jgi:hypothetical protein
VGLHSQVVDKSSQHLVKNYLGQARQMARYGVR